MTTIRDESGDYRLVAAYFQGHGLRLSRFSKSETRAGKTPDFRVMDDVGLFAYCEVKSPRDEWLDEQIDQAEPGEIVGRPRPDPIFNRLSTMVGKQPTNSMLSIQSGQCPTFSRL